MSKNLYDILGVSHHATAEQIRKSYLLRSKMMHPDRFDPVKQKSEWDLANELLKELNHAYSVLRDPRSRGQYDGNAQPASSYRPQTRSQRSDSASSTPPSGEASRQSSRPDSPPPSARMGPLKAGTGIFHTMPRTTQRRLVERVTGRNKVQHAIRLGGIEWSYLWTAGLCVWAYYLFHSALKSHWDKDTHFVLIAITCVVAIIQGFNISTIVRWHASQLGHWLFITPLYIIRTRFEEVRYWPIWEISKIRGTHNYRNGVYQNTSIEMNFTSGHERVTIAPEEAYDEILEALKGFDDKARNAKFHQNWAYFVDQDDFRECKPGRNDATTGLSWKRTVVSFIAVLGGWAALLSGAHHLNKEAPGDLAEIGPRHLAAKGPAGSNIPGQPKVAKPASSTAAPADNPVPTPRPRAEPSLRQQAKTFREPALTMPPSGEIRLYSRRLGVAPLEIRSADGAHYLVKIVDLSNDETTLSVFVRGGETVTVKLPLGAFEIRYAWGDTWYGYRYLFGPETFYTKADRPFTFHQIGVGVTSSTISLYKIPEGNLSTQSIHPDEF